MLLFSTANTFAQAVDTPEVDLGVDVSLSVTYDEKDSPDRKPTRMPIHRPVINVTTNVITVPESLIGYELEIVSDGVLIYSTIATSSVIQRTNKYCQW